MKKEQEKVSVLYAFMSTLFAVCLIASNLFEIKQIAFFGRSQTGGLLIFPISYIINDCVCEVWGYGKARTMIWTGFKMNVFFVVMATLCDLLPGADYCDSADAFHAIFGLAPRIVIGSMAAFLAGSFLNAYVMSRMKARDHDRRFSLRAIVSTLLGEGADSLVFFPIALGGVVPWSELPFLMITQILLKTIYEVLALPVTIRVVRQVKKRESEEIPE